MTNRPAYRLQHLRKEHGASFQLQVEHLAIADGEVFCLLGPTGAGKSTLLRLLSGLELATAGSVELKDHPLNGPGTALAVLRSIATVHQRPLLLTGTVRRNVEYGLRVRGMEDAAAVHGMLDRLGLTTLAEQSARTLSGGQCQLAGVARALVLKPDVLLLDEPTANLDPAHVALVEQAVLDVQRRSKMTVVWATHNVFQARRVAQAVGLLLNGSLIETAPTQRFFENPADERTAQFVQGKMVY